MEQGKYLYSDIKIPARSQKTQSQQSKGSSSVNMPKLAQNVQLKFNKFKSSDRKKNINEQIAATQPIQ